MSDSLVREWQEAGSEWAFNELIRMVTPELERCANRWHQERKLRRRAGPSDLVQQALLRLVTEIERRNDPFSNFQEFTRFAQLCLRRAFSGLVRTHTAQSRDARMYLSPANDGSDRERGVDGLPANHRVSVSEYSYSMAQSGSPRSDVALADIVEGINRLPKGLRETAELLAEGNSVNEIAQIREIGSRAVRKQRKAIEKLLTQTL